MNKVALRLHVGFACALVALRTPGQAQPCTAPPGRVSGFDATFPLTCFVNLQWHPTQGAEGYSVLRSLAPNVATATVIGTTTQTTYDDHSAPGRTQLYYWVRASNACGEGPTYTQLGLSFVESVPRPSVNAREVCGGIDITWIVDGNSPGDYFSTLWRSPTSVFSDAQPIAEDLLGARYLDDTAPTGASWYWVVTRARSCVSPTSNPAYVFNHGPLPRPSVHASRGASCDAVWVEMSSPTACQSQFTLERAEAAANPVWAVIATGYPRPYADVVPERTRTYLYRVTFRNQFGESPTSLQASGYAGAPPDLYELGDVTTYSHGGMTLHTPVQPEQVLDAGTFQWRKDGIDLVDGGRVLGSRDRNLQIRPGRPEDEGFYEVTITTACGTATSTPALVTFVEGSPCPRCGADYNQDGGVDGADVEAFLTDWADAGLCADINEDGGVDGSDLEPWFQGWCCGSC